MNPNNIIDSSSYYKQPIWFNGLNTIWKNSFFLGTEVSLNKDYLIKAARKKTGYHDLGKDFWVEPLERMLSSIQQEANLHPIGQFISQQRIINLLSVRLRAEAHFKKYPEILEQDLYPAMIIVGLQRTGTTKLQRLLAADPDNRAILSWEGLNPAPINGDAKTGVERIKIAKTSVKALKYMSPGFFAIHPIEYEAPEEDVLLLDISFLSTTAEATMHVPSYSKWLEETDQSAAYAYMVKLLKLLQWQRPAKRWVLKTPHHMEFLDLAKKHLGDVQFIWTHRNVYESIPSYLSMISYSRRLFSDFVNPNQVAKHWIPKNGLMLSKALDFHNSNDNRKLFTNINYKHLVKDSLAEIEKIYSDRGEKVSPELKLIFEDSNSKNPKGKYGQHNYNLSDFGVDEPYIDMYTDAYQKFRKL